MTGVHIIGHLLMNNADLVAAVPIERIKAGALPDAIALPALLVRLVSSVERQSLRRGEVVRTTERISVTVRANSYREQTRIVQLVKNTCAGRTGAIGGGQSVSVLTAGTGPDVLGPASSFEQTQDFRVSYDAASTASEQVSPPAAPVAGEPAAVIENLDWAP